MLRNEGGGRPTVAVVDLNQYRDESADAEPFLLQPYDVVYVPKSPIAHVNDFVELYIDRVIPRAAQNMVGFNYLYGSRTGLP